MKKLLTNFLKKAYETNRIATLSSGNRAQRREAKRLIKKL